MALIFKVPDPLGIAEAVGVSAFNVPQVITGAAVNALKGQLFKIPTREIEEAVDVSELGTPIYDYLHLREGSYTTLDGETVSYDGIILETVILEVNKPKNIIKTPIQGRNGTVKEYISDGDYVINVRGVITTKENVFPLEKVRVFRKIMDVPQQISVTSQFLNEVFGIDDIVIDGSPTISQIEGSRNQVEFSFQALSDEALDIEVLE